MASPSIPAPADASAPIVGHITPWYFRRRMGPLIAVFLVMGLYFIYDGKIGYPKANSIFDKKDWFETQILKSYNDAKSQGQAALDAWTAQAKAQDWPIGSDGAPTRWVSWAAERNLPEKPHHYTDSEIQQQFWFGGACILAGLIITIVMLSNRGKTIRAEADFWITPEGRKIPFAHVAKLDLRKWRHKGIAYAWYRDSENAPLRRTVLDDLKFTHAQLILDRLRAHFTGDLIENGAKETESEAAARETIR